MIPLRVAIAVLPALISFFVTSSMFAMSTPDDSSSDGTGTAEYSISAFGYWVEGEEFFALPVVTADFGDFHLEGRYNYEDLRTGSLFAGWNFGFGSEVEVVITPMAGLAFGQTNGLVPALEAEVFYDIFGFSLEGEYVLDLEDAEANFLYVWSELYASPTDWLYAGLAAQRMRVVDTEVEVSRGLMVGGGGEGISATLYFFDVTESESFFVLGIEWIP